MASKKVWKSKKALRWDLAFEEAKVARFQNELDKAHERARVHVDQALDLRTERDKAVHHAKSCQQDANKWEDAGSRLQDELATANESWAKEKKRADDLNRQLQEARRGYAILKEALHPAPLPNAATGYLNSIYGTPKGQYTINDSANAKDVVDIEAAREVADQFVKQIGKHAR